MSDSDKSKSQAVRLWKAVVAERSACRADRQEARAALVMWIDRELQAHATHEPVEMPAKLSLPRMRRGQFPI